MYVLIFLYMYTYAHLYHIYADNINYVENVVQVNFMAIHYITKFELNIAIKLAIQPINKL